MKRHPALVALLLGATATVAAAQRETTTVRREANQYVVETRDQYGRRASVLPGVPQLLEEFASAAANPGGRGDRLAVVLASHPLFPSATVDSVADGLERLAITHPDFRVATAATISLGMLGEAREGRTPRPGTLQRMLRIYARQDRRVRSSIITYLGHAAERGRAVAFLRSVAAEEPSPANEGLPTAAVFALSQSDEGAAVLRELHQKKLVKDPDARFSLAAFSRRAYRSPASH